MCLQEKARSATAIGGENPVAAAWGRHKTRGNFKNGVTCID